MNHAARIKRITVYIIFIVSLLSLLGCSNQNIENHNISGNIIDLKSWEFNTTNIEIGGYSAFYWEELIQEGDSLSVTQYADSVSLIHSWNNQPNKSHNYPAAGYASYNFQINIPENIVGQHLILRPKHFIAYSAQIFVNGTLVSHNGYVGKSQADSSYKPSRNTICTPFVADSSSLNIIVWVANYSHFRGGIFNEFVLGTAEKMLEQRERAIAIDLIVIVSLLIMFFYHFILYFVNTEDTTSLFFGITCLIFAFDFSFQDTMSFFLFFPKAGFTFASLLHLSLPYMIPSSFIFFLYALFPDEVSKKIRNLTGIVTLVLVGITLLNKPSIYMHFIEPHFVYNLFIVSYIYYVAVKAFYSKREGAGLFLVAYFIFSICAVNDILYVFEVIHTANLVSAGLMVFVLSLSILQGRRMSKMNKRNVKLSVSLQELNLDLEKRIDQRTGELSVTNQRLRQLIHFKEDMTNMIIHDLKSPLNIIINAKLLDADIRERIVRQAGYRMQNLIQNILDVYRYKSVGITPKKTKIELDKIVSDALEEVGFSAQQKSITFKVENECLFYVNIDKEIIHRVIVNILNNAIKHSPNNKDILIQCTLNQQKTVKVSIKNFGQEIPFKQQKLIFNKFEQGNKEGQSVEHSSGLGLTFCKMGIEAHGGTIGVTSESKGGVSFWFTLPEANECNKKTDMGEISQPETLQLSKADKAYLSSYVKEIKQYELFEISAINIVLNRIDVYSESIKNWHQQLEQAIYNGDSQAFKDLINL